MEVVEVVIEETKEVFKVNNQRLIGYPGSNIE